MQSQDLKYTFFGTPRFAEIILEKLIKAGYKPSLVVTAPDKPVGRKQELTPPPVKVLAEKEGLKIAQPETPGKNFITDYGLRITDYDLFIVAAYGKILPKEILDIPKHGALNVHPSLLPKHRGPSPIQYSILKGDERTGVTIMLMDEKMDHGPILASRELEITNYKTQITNKSQITKPKLQNQPTYPELHDVLAEMGAELLVETIPKWIDGEIEPQEQNHDEATYTKIIKREDGRIDWEKSAEEIERMSRAFMPWPGIFTLHENKRLKILSLETQKEKTKKPGRVVKYNDSFAIETRDGLIIPKEVQLEGKKIQNTNEFLRGHPDIINKFID